MANNGGETGEESFEEHIREISSNDQWKQGVDNMAAMTAYLWKSLMEEELPLDVATELACTFLQSIFDKSN